MRAILKNDLSPKVFSKLLVDIDNGQIVYNENIQLIKLSENVFNINDSKNASIVSAFPSTRDNYSDHQLLCERTILNTKSVHFDEINFIYKKHCLAI